MKPIRRGQYDVKFRTSEDDPDPRLRSFYGVSLEGQIDTGFLCLTVLNSEQHPKLLGALDQARGGDVLTLHGRGEPLHFTVHSHEFTDYEDDATTHFELYADFYERTF